MRRDGVGLRFDRRSMKVKVGVYIEYLSSPPPEYLK